MADDNGAILTKLGEIHASQTHTREAIGDIRNDQKETTKALHRVEMAISKTDERLTGHMTDVNRRFEDQAEDITRAHKKISDGTSITMFGDATPPVHTPMPPGQKAGIGATLVAIVTAIGAAIAQFSGKGPTQ